MEYLQDFPPGPLDFYRRKASFDWKKLKIFIDTEDIVKFEHELHNFLQTHPEFQTDFQTQSFDEQRRIATRRSIVLNGLEIATIPKIIENLKRPSLIHRTQMQLCPSTCIKDTVGNRLFTNVIRSHGTQRHYTYVEQIENGEIFGCFCLTEIAHGSNAKGMRTTATYDKDKQQFILHTPDFEAAKCWAGALGQVASHAVVYAQLYIDGVNYGLHNFVVPIRVPNTLLPYPGVIVGDMGKKIGLNGVDNGFLIFNNYHIPRENLLNKNGDVTPEGKYVSAFKNARDRHGAALSALSVGRVNITSHCEFYGTKALTIAVRYAAVRKQFGPVGLEEIPILEYQSHQYRLLPYVAAAYVVRIFSLYLVETMYQFIIDSTMSDNKESLVDLGVELHAVSSASKPVAGWTFRDAIQECREACGGHGYLKVAGIGDIRNDQDACCTYEGENHVLVQQNSNWLLKLWSTVEKGGRISTPLKSANFLSDALKILQSKFIAVDLEEVSNPKTIIDAYQWLICYLLKQTKHKLDTLAAIDRDQFWPKNNIQVFYAKSASIAFIEHFFLQRMLTVIGEASDNSIKNVLLKLFSLYGLWSLKKFLATLYEGGYAQGPKLNYLVQEAILKLCNEVKDDAVALIDAIGPPDFILNSALGASDGQVYHRLQAAMFQSPYGLGRPSWWQEVVNWHSNLPNKL